MQLLLETLPEFDCWYSQQSFFDDLFSLFLIESIEIFTKLIQFWFG